MYPSRNPRQKAEDLRSNRDTKASGTHAKHTLLLIDDNAIQAATRQTILKRAGYFVIAVLSPERALEQLRNNDYPDPIDLVITDHIMPGMNGAEFVTRLREVPRISPSSSSAASPKPKTNTQPSASTSA
jgi:CheY-like chemotaxis protein